MDAAPEQSDARVFVLGISGAVGSLLVERLQAHGARVGGLVRREQQRDEWKRRGVEVTMGDIATIPADELAARLAGFDVVVFTAGSNGGAREVTRTVDGIGVETALAAALLGGASRFVLVSVLPESWRDRDLGPDVEFYFAVKKQAEVAVTRSPLDWVVLRPSLLLDAPGVGTVSLGPAQIHHEVTREDVAATLVALVHEPRIQRQILELDRGATPVVDAVAANVRDG